MPPSSPSPNVAHPLLIVLSGPSGVGKDSVLARMRALGRPYYFTVTATTRPRRPMERDGVDYVFVAREAFQQMVEKGELLEWAEVYGNFYGVPRSQVRDALSQGRDVVIKTDVQGAATIRKMAPDVLLIFLAPPDMAELARRITQRVTESPEALRLRLKTAEQEMQEAARFDYTVINYQGRLDDAVDEIEAIIARERRRSPPRRVSL